MKPNKKWGIALIALLAYIGVVLFCRTFLNTYYMSVINECLIYFICASGMTVMMGYGGMMCMCSISMMGMGAFVCAQAYKNYAVPAVPAILLGVLAGALLALIIGMCVLRLQGVFFVFGTLGIVYMMQTVYNNYVPLSNGTNGLAQIPKMQILGYTFNDYYAWLPLLIILAAFCIFVIQRIKNSTLGRSLMAVRDDPIAAQSLGVNVYRTKVIGFVIGGAYAAFAGAIYALHYGNVSYISFSGDAQVKMVTMVMLGGASNVIGTFLGTFIVSVLPEVLRFMQNYMNVANGVLLVLVMIFMPRGLFGLFQDIRFRIKKSRARVAAAARSPQNTEV